MSFTKNGESDRRVLGSEQIGSQNLIQFCGLELTNHEKMNMYISEKKKE